MKMNILLLFTCLALTCSMRLKEHRSSNTTSAATEFNLLIFGDNGEIDYFYKNAHKPQKDLQKDAKEASMKKWYEENLLAETYETEGYKCVVKKAAQEFDLNKEGGMTNFDNFNKNADFKKLLSTAEKIVFLGDMIYPETKFLGTGGWDKPYVLLNKPKWIERLICSWNVFYRSLEKMNLSKISSENGLTVDGKVDFIAGNHSFDIDIHEEENQVKKAIKTNLVNKLKSKEHLIGRVANKTQQTFTVQPRFLRIIFKNFIVKFLDFNSGLLLCVHMKDEATYNDCINKKFLPSAVGFKEARTYYKRLYGAVKFNFKTQDDEPKVTYWNVLRAHHPPANPEDGDEDFYFTPVEIDKLTKEGDKYESLFEVMGKMKVHIFLGSHVHNAEVLAIHYSTAIIPKSAFKKEDRPKEWGCYEAPDELKGVAVYKQTCTEDFKRSLKFNDADPDKQILYIFVTGNSGRNYDPLRPSDITNGFLVWSRATQNKAGKFNYGFTFANFSAARVAIDFYELDADENKLVKAASFTVEKGENAPTKKEIDDLKATIQKKN